VDSLRQGPGDRHGGREQHAAADEGEQERVLERVEEGGITCQQAILVDPDESHRPRAGELVQRQVHRFDQRVEEEDPQ
jgi:hypothetical protein